MSLFTRYFSVGNGSASNAVAVQLEQEGIAAGSLQVCVTAADAIACGPASEWPHGERFRAARGRLGLDVQ